MKKEMSVMGVGGKIAVPTLLCTALGYLVNRLAFPAFQITGNDTALLITGIALAVVGFSLNMVAAMTMLRAHRENRLATTGLYAVFANPMYVLQIFLTLPGLILLLNSWPAMLGVVAAFVAYRAFVHEEEDYLRARFGGEYDRYRSGVAVKFL